MKRAIGAFLLFTWLLVPMKATQALASEVPALSFPDLPGYEWADPAIASLKARGVLRGRGLTAYEPAQAVTNAELAVSVVRLIGAEQRVRAQSGAAVEATLARLPDGTSIPEWARPEVAWLVQAGAISEEQAL